MPPRKKTAKKKATKRAPKKSTGKRMGRPPLQFNLEQVEALGQIQCTLEEVAIVLGCNTETVERRLDQKSKYYDENFCAAFKRGQANGRLSLRRSQFRLAGCSYREWKDKHGRIQKSGYIGNPGMAIFLGKNYLGQKDDWEEGNPYDDKAIIKNPDAVLDVSGIDDKYWADVNAYRDQCIDNGNGNGHNGGDGHDNDGQTTDARRKKKGA